MANWTFLTNHGAVLAEIAKKGTITAKDIAGALDITERSVLRIISDLETDGYIEKRRLGRINSYLVNAHMPVRGINVRDVRLQELLEVLLKEK